MTTMLSTSHHGNNIHPYMLLVTDDKPTIPMLESTLNEAGFKAQHVVDGKGPFRYIHEETEVVILDMPASGKNRRGWLIELKEQWSSVPVIIITANDDLQIMISSMKEESFDCLAKPFNLQEMVSVVTRSLNTKENFSCKQQVFL